MNKLILFIFCMLIIISSVSALDCQYTKEVVDSTEIKLLPFDNNGNKLDEVRIEIFDEINRPLKISNYNGVSLSIELNIRTNWCGDTKFQKYTLVVPEEDFLELEAERFWFRLFCNEYYFYDEYSIKYLDSEVVDVRPVEEKTYVSVCDGKDDGKLCDSSNECGGGYCVKGICTFSELCHNNDCDCDSNEVQCTNNKQCVEKGIVRVDARPKCDLPEECETGYINEDTGLCAKSPSQIEEENYERLREEMAHQELIMREENDRLREEMAHQEKMMQEKNIMFQENLEWQKNIIIIISTILVIIVILIIIGIPIYFKQKNKSEETKQETIKLRIKEIESEINKINYELIKKNEEIDKLENTKKKTKEENARLIELNKTTEKLIYDLENKFIKYAKIKHGNKIELNTQTGYLEFKDTKKPIHLVTYKDNYPNEDLSGKEIHHINHNKLDNHISNLIALDRNLHKYKIKHLRIDFNNWKSGIKELKNAGLIERDFPREVKKRLDHEKNTFKI